MRKQTESLILLVILALFTIAMLISGGNSQKEERIVTIKLENLPDDQINKRINETLELVKGVRSYVVNYRTRTCTLRYLSNQVDLSTIVQILAKYGIKITPITENELSINQLDTTKPAFSIKITPASQIKP